MNSISFRPPQAAQSNGARAADHQHLIERCLRDPSIDLAKLEHLVALQERMLRWQAESEWNTAMAEAQAGMHAVANDSANPQTRSKYASYAAIDAAIRPIYSSHGFSLSFNTMSSREGSITIICDVAKGGHARRYQIDMPADGKGPKGNDVMSKTHATGSAVTYGMRYLVKMIFNVATGEADDDGNAARNTARARNQATEDERPDRQAPSNAVHEDAYDRETGEIRDETAIWKASYIQEAREYIRRATDAKALHEWWSSEATKKARRDFHLNREEMSDLVEFCRARISALKADQPKPMTLAQQAGMLCNDRSFIAFMGEQVVHDIIDGAAACADAVRAHCGVSSRGDLKAGTPEGDAWVALHGQYLAWQAAERAGAL